MKIEIELPEIEGYKYTGEYRKPKTGEWGHCYKEGKLFRVYSNLGDYRPCHILKEIEAAKPKELTLEEKVKAEYKDRTNQEVIMLTYNDSNGYLSIKDCPDCEPHVILQSMKGFYKYVYLCNNGEFSLGHTPTSQFAMYETVAVLFTKDSK